jgi:NitT/TauT family transport system substrate-binding protein
MSTTPAPTSRRKNLMIGLGAAVAVVAVIAVAIWAFIPKASSTPAASEAAPAELRIGYFANITHAPALVAVQEKLYEKYLPNTKVSYFVFPAGPAAVEAFKGGALDVSFIGPNPSINAFATTNGELVRIVSGATSGGAAFVVQPGITADTLKGKNFATPQLGNTQDVALRSYLTSKGLTFTPGGDVTITPTENATTLSLFQKGQIDGAWVPEPWASRLVIDGKGKVLVNEKDLWPGGNFVTTNVVATTKYLEKYPSAVKAVLAANLEAYELIKNDPAKAKELAQAEILKQTGKQLSAAVLDSAWSNLSFGYEPYASSLQKNADDAVAAGVLKLNSKGLNGIYDLTALNQLLTEKKLPTVDSGGFGKQ